MNLSETFGQLGRYVLTGGSAAVVDLGVFALLHPAVLPVPAAAACSFGLAAVENYVVTSRFVYRQPLSVRRWLMFLLFAFLGFVVNVSTTVAVADLTPLPSVVAKIVGIGTAFFLNFLLNSIVVFRRRA